MFLSSYWGGSDQYDRHRPQNVAQSLNSRNARIVVSQFTYILFQKVIVKTATFQRYSCINGGHCVELPPSALAPGPRVDIHMSGSPRPPGRFEVKNSVLPSCDNVAESSANGEFTGMPRLRGADQGSFTL